MKLLKIESKTAVLIGVGSSICGGSAIAATAPVIDADDEDVARSISVIFLFNILAALIFPALGHSTGLGTEGFAVFAGTAVNDTSSVTAAASTAENLYHTSGILSAAVTVKLTRTLAIIPSHDHHFKWWFEISPIRALLQARPKGRISQANYRLPLKEVIYAYLLAWFLLPVRQYTF